MLKRKRDSRILLMCKALMRQRLTKEDHRVVILIQSQLNDDWRRTLVVELNRLLKKYRHVKSVQNLDL